MVSVMTDRQEPVNGGIKFLLFWEKHYHWFSVGYDTFNSLLAKMDSYEGTCDLAFVLFPF